MKTSKVNGVSKSKKSVSNSIVAHKASGKNSEAGTKEAGKKREAIFSRSRDTHEDRGARQAKTSSNPQSVSRGRGR